MHESFEQVTLDVDRRRAVQLRYFSQTFVSGQMSVCVLDPRRTFVQLVFFSAASASFSNIVSGSFFFGFALAFGAPASSSTIIFIPAFSLGSSGSGSSTVGARLPSPTSISALLPTPLGKR